MIRKLLLAAFICAHIACERAVEIKLNDPGQVLSVDASIENGAPPLVMLFNSFSFFGKLSTTDLTNAFVHNAKVTLSDGTRTNILKEYPIVQGSAVLFIYSIDTASLSNAIYGKLNTTYTLTIESGGKTYTSRTTIPTLAKRIDSLTWRRAPNTDDTTKAVVFAKITDPAGLGNYMRYYTRRNDSAFLPGLNSVYDDDIFDGTTYEVQVLRGVDRNGTESFDDDNFGFFKRGDTVDVKLCNIDKTHYDFWRTWETAQSNNGNPFGTPIKVLGNISNGALGYFGGYAAQVKRVIIPK